jgi:hypothetical protein
MKISLLKNCIGRILNSIASVFTGNKKNFLINSVAFKNKSLNCKI